MSPTPIEKNQQQQSPVNETIGYSLKDQNYVNVPESDHSSTSDVSELSRGPAHRAGRRIATNTVYDNLKLSSHKSTTRRPKRDYLPSETEAIFKFILKHDLEKYMYSTRTAMLISIKKVFLHFHCLLRANGLQLVMYIFVFFKASRSDLSEHP